MASNKHSRSNIKRKSFTGCVCDSGKSIHLTEASVNRDSSVNLNISLKYLTLGRSDLIKVIENNRLEDRTTLNVTIMFDSSSQQLEELLFFKNKNFNHMEECSASKDKWDSTKRESVFMVTLAFLLISINAVFSV